ncbi:hypothetical protein [Peribacillus sp. SCS-155]
MLSNEELQIIRLELVKLEDELEKCPVPSIKSQIYNDILFISNIIEQEG